MIAYLTVQGFWLLWFALVCVIFLVCSLRTNAIFVFIFFTFDIGMGLLIAAYWVLAEDMTGNAALADKLMVVSRSQVYSQ